MTKREVLEAMRHAQERRTERRVLVGMTAFMATVTTAAVVALLREGAVAWALFVVGVMAGCPLVAEWRRGRRERAEWAKHFREATDD